MRAGGELPDIIPGYNALPIGEHTGVVSWRQGRLINNFARVFYDPGAFTASRNAGTRPARSSR